MAYSSLIEAKGWADIRNFRSDGFFFPLDTAVEALLTESRKILSPQKARLWN
jgi:hypothetical protein